MIGVLLINEILCTKFNKLQYEGALYTTWEREWRPRSCHSTSYSNRGSAVYNVWEREWRPRSCHSTSYSNRGSAVYNVWERRDLAIQQATVIEGALYTTYGRESGARDLAIQQATVIEGALYTTLGERVAVLPQQATVKRERCMYGRESRSCQTSSVIEGALYTMYGRESGARGLAMHYTLEQLQ